MSQLDDTILDALTHVTFPKGFAQAEPAWVVTVDGVDYPLWQTDALVVGSGAAGLRAAVELKRRQQNVLIATAGYIWGRRHVLVPINRRCLPPLPQAMATTSPNWQRHWRAVGRWITTPLMSKR